jgi:hypothetical protein
MQLYLDVDADPKTGWLGYDYVINRRRTGKGRVSVERNVGNRYEWVDVGDAPYQLGERELEVGIPWKVLGISQAPPVLEFKWADNLVETGDWSDFTLHGDSAPNDRFNYQARTR